MALPHCSTRRRSGFGWFRTSWLSTNVSFLSSCLCVLALVAVRQWKSPFLFHCLYRKQGTVPAKEKGNGFKKKEKGREKNPLNGLFCLDVFCPAFTPCFWCTSVKCAARALAHGTQLKSQYIFFYLPRVSTLKQAAGLAGFFPYLSPAHSLAQCAPIHTLLSSRLLRPKT